MGGVGVPTFGTSGRVGFPWDIHSRKTSGRMPLLMTLLGWMRDAAGVTRNRLHLGKRGA